MILTPDGTQGAALSPETRAAIDVVAATARALSAADVGVGAQAQAQQIAPPLLAPIQPHQRAASDTDSPSRGVPAFPTDPGKQITGGFGDQLATAFEAEFVLGLVGRPALGTFHVNRSPLVS